MLFAVLVEGRNYCNCYLIPAQSAKKAEQSVRRYLKTAGQNNDAAAVTALPARRLPSAKAKNAPQKKRGVVIAWPTKRKIKKILPAGKEINEATERLNEHTGGKR
jgi:hypothetical protein